MKTSSRTVLTILTSAVQKAISVHLTRAPLVSGRFTAVAKKEKKMTQEKKKKPWKHFQFPIMWRDIEVQLELLVPGGEMTC